MTWHHHVAPPHFYCKYLTCSHLGRHAGKRCHTLPRYVIRGSGTAADPMQELPTADDVTRGEK